MNKIVVIGGRERAVNFGRNAQIEIEALTGLSLMSVNKNQNLGYGSYTYIRAAAFAGLKWGLYDPIKGTEPRPDFTLFQVGDWLEEDLTPSGPMAVIMKAWQESLPLPKKKIEEAKPQE